MEKCRTDNLQKIHGKLTQRSFKQKKQTIKNTLLNIKYKIIKHYFM